MSEHSSHNSHSSHEKKEIFAWRTATVLVFLAAIFALYKTPVASDTPANTASFAGVSLKLLYATSTAARAQGLGGRASMPANEAMLFVFPTDDTYGFWMKDMDFPIDIFWIDAQGRVVTIEKNVSPESYPTVFYPTAPARYVLETVAGFATAHAVATGTPLELSNLNSLSEVSK